MKVILLKDVARIGRKTEVKEVPDGHALNFLIPRKMAIIATPENMKKHTAESDHKKMQIENLQKHFVETVEKLSKEVVVIQATANDQGGLFKSVNAEDIAVQLASHGFPFAKNNIILEHPIKQIGKYEIELVHGSAKAKINLEVIKK